MIFQSNDLSSIAQTLALKDFFYPTNLRLLLPSHVGILIQRLKKCWIENPSLDPNLCKNHPKSPCGVMLDYFNMCELGSDFPIQHFWSYPITSVYHITHSSMRHSKLFCFLLLSHALSPSETIVFLTYWYWLFSMVVINQPKKKNPTQLSTALWEK